MKGTKKENERTHQADNIKRTYSIIYSNRFSKNRGIVQHLNSVY